MLPAQEFTHLAVTGVKHTQNPAWKMPAGGERTDVPATSEQCEELWMCLTCSTITELLYSGQDLHEGKAYLLMQFFISVARLRLFCVCFKLQLLRDAVFNTAKIKRKSVSCEFKQKRTKKNKWVSIT